MRPLAVLATLWLLASSAAAECRASASGRVSASVTLSPASGILCLDDVALHDGPSCGGAARWTTTLGCNEARRLVPTDEGTLVALLADRASRREWEIVRLFVPLPDRLEVRSVRLEELPGLPASARRPRLSIDARTLRVAPGAGPPIEVSIASVATLGRRTGRRRLRR